MILPFGIIELQGGIKLNKDITTKMLLEYPDVFADIENVCLFGGKPVIKPDDLELCPQEIVYKETDGQIHEHRGDIRMRLKEKGMELAILHIENQSGVSNVMPLRDMGYIYSDYQNQLRALKEKNRKAGRHYVMQEIGDDQKLCPVIMLVLYYGTEKWTGPTRLMDMLDIPEGDRELWEMVIEDHKIHLIDLSRQNDAEVDQYTSDLWYIVKCLKCENDKEKYKNFLIEGAHRKMQHPEAVIDMLTSLTGKVNAKKMADQLICDQKKEGGDCTMYTFLDYFEEVGMEKGIKKGMEKGIEKGREEEREEIYYRMFRNNRTPEAISDFTGESVEYLCDLQKKYLATVREGSCYNGERGNDEKHTVGVENKTDL